MDCNLESFELVLKPWMLWPSNRSGNSAMGAEVGMEKPPYVPISASVLFVVALVIFRDLGKAVGTMVVYLGVMLLFRFRRQPPDLLTLIAPVSSSRVKKANTSPTWPWQLVTLLVGVMVIAVGVSFIVLST